MVPLAGDAWRGRVDSGLACAWKRRRSRGEDEGVGPRVSCASAVGTAPGTAVADRQPPASDPPLTLSLSPVWLSGRGFETPQGHHASLGEKGLRPLFVDFIFYFVFWLKNIIQLKPLIPSRNS